MALCSSNCAQNPQAVAGGGCRLQTRPGGIDRLVFARCDITFTAISSLEEWQTKIAAGNIVFSGQVLGQKPKGTVTKKKIASCRPEMVTGVTRQLQFKDANADNSGFTDYDFWNDKDVNQDIFVVGYLTCDELFYGFFPYAMEIDDTRPENSDEEFAWDGIVQYNSRTATKPVKLTGIGALIAAQTESGS
jgi:hypothetical protein